RDYEIVIVLGNDPPFDGADLRQHLRAWDQIVSVPTSNIFELYDHGVAAASAPIIFLTEAHAAARPGTVDATLTWFRDHHGPGFYTHGDGPRRGNIGNLE